MATNGFVIDSTGIADPTPIQQEKNCSHMPDSISAIVDVWNTNKIQVYNAKLFGMLLLDQKISQEQADNILSMFDTTMHTITATRSEYPMSSDYSCLLYTSPSPRDATLSRMPSSA